MQDHDGVHLEAQVDGSAGVGVALGKGHVAIVVGFHLAEPVQVGREILLPQAILGQLIQETVESVSVVVVMAISLITIWYKSLMAAGQNPVNNLKSE